MFCLYIDVELNNGLAFVSLHKVLKNEPLVSDGIHEWRYTQEYQVHIHIHTHPHTRTRRHTHTRAHTHTFHLIIYFYSTHLWKAPTLDHSVAAERSSLDEDARASSSY
jgi:hypothetical protein